MESRLLDCLEQTWLFQRDVVFSGAGDFSPFRQITVDLSSLVLVSLPLGWLVKDSASIEDDEDLSGAV